MKLAEFLASRFRGDIRFRGDSYLKDESIAIARVTPDHIFGVVRDGVEYETQLSRENGDLKMHCTCRSNGGSGTCKHLWATIRAADEGGYVTGPLRPGHVPPFLAEAGPGAFDDWEADFDPLDEFDVPFGSRAGRTEALRTEPRLKPWEAQLHDLRRKMESGGSGTRSARREREIRYEIDLEESRQAGLIVVQTSQRQRRTSGEWGKLKPLKLRPGRLDEVEHEDDRQILAYLLGGTPERANWYAQQTELQGAVHRFRISYELSSVVLPLMCATGRVYCLDGQGQTHGPLDWDGGDPWEMAMRVDFDDEGGQWRLIGELRRGGDVLPAGETRLIVPGGLVLARTQIGRLQDFGASDWISLLTRTEPLSVPDGEEHELVDRLLDMPALPRLELPDELRLEEIRCEPVPRLMIRSPRTTRWHLERLVGELRFDYLGTLVPASSPRWAIVQREQGRSILRNRLAEDRAWQRLHELGFRRLLDPKRGIQDVSIAAREFGPAVRALIGEGWQIHADGQQVRQAGPLEFRIKSQIDWFELHGSANFEGRTASFPELLAALARGDSTVRLDDGSLGILPEDWARKFGLLAGLGAVDEDHLRFTNNQAALLDALLASQESVDFDSRFDEVRAKFRSFSGVEPADEPDGFRGTLRGYQKEGLGWLRFLQDFGLGGCLADDMGLGKTVQVLALLLDRRRRQKKTAPSLIVVPKSLLFNWRQEAERFTPELKVLEYTGVGRALVRKQFARHDIVLTTYGTLRRDIVNLKDVRFDYAVLDEAQTIKNPGSQVAKASRLLAADHRMALSGTPIENHLGDLWSIFEFLNPGMLGRSSVFRSYTSDLEDDESRRVLSQGLRPFILRRTKKEVASELPERFEQTIYCQMRKEQRRLYEELRDHYRGSLLGLIDEQGLARSKMHVLEALLRLRQAACHPALLNRGEADDPSAKLDFLRPHLEELLDEGHKALVFSQFTSMLAIVKKHLDAHGIAYEYLDGQTRNRKQVVEHFQNDPDCGVFLISLKAGGLGLNLAAADYVFLLDPWWNPAVEAQAIDRAHRIGQTRQVFAYRLICKGTVEEKIAELQNQKRELAEAILSADGSVLKDLSAEDLEMLLS